MAAADINKLLSLPQKERRKIAEKLWTALVRQNPLLHFLRKKTACRRWDRYIAGKMKFIQATKC
jgi:hypothetical protein